MQEFVTFRGLGKVPSSSEAPRLRLSKGQLALGCSNQGRVGRVATFQEAELFGGQEGSLLGSSDARMTRGLRLSLDTEVQIPIGGLGTGGQDVVGGLQQEGEGGGRVGRLPEVHQLSEMLRHQVFICRDLVIGPEDFYSPIRNSGSGNEARGGCLRCFRR